MRPTLSNINHPIKLRCGAMHMNKGGRDMDDVYPVRLPLYPTDPLEDDVGIPIKL